jgi:O-antigen ligase
VSVFAGEDHTLFYFWFLIFIFVALASGANVQTVKSSINYWIFGSLLVAGACYFEIFHHIRFPGSRYYIQGHPYDFRPTGFFHNENNLAIYMSVSSIFVATKLITTSFFKSFFYLLAILWFGYIIVETSSRGGLVVFLVGIAAYFLSNFARFRGLTLRLVLFGSALIGFAFALDSREVLINRVTEIYAITIQDEARLSLFLLAVDAATENFGFGVGAGNIESYVRTFGETRVENVHNWLGEVLGNTGFPGILLWTLFLLIIGTSMIWRLVSKGRLDPYERALVIIFMLFPVWQFVVSSMIQFMTFWVLMMYIIIYTGYGAKAKKDYKANF